MPRAVQSFQFDPIPMLDAEAASVKSLTFDAKSSREALAWQKKARAALAKCLGFLDTPKVAPRPREIGRGGADRGSYVRHKIVIRTSAKSELPLYLLVPKSIRDGERRPCVLALHGHGYGAKDIVGLWEDGSERRAPDGYHDDFACRLAQRGFVVAAPEISCFGERRMADELAFRASGLSASCHNVATYAMMLGGSAAGLRVLDGLRIVDYLRTLDYVDGDNIGVMGISGGGMHAFFSAAIDPRLRAAAISGYFCDWRHSILALFHCTCNFVPGLLKLGELADLAALLAPRPVLIEHGVRDDIFPIGHVKRTVNRARRAWKLFDADGDFETDYFEGRHRINGPAAYEFLAKHLGLEVAKEIEPQRSQRAQRRA